MNNVVDVDDSNFETEVLESKVPVLVDFSAEWCGPCQKQTPILEKFAAEQGETVKVCKIDIDSAPNFTAKMGIKSVPSLLMFEGGKQTGMRVGLSSLQDIRTLFLTKAV